MGMTVTRRKDTGTSKVIVHRIADIRGGVSVVTSEIVSDFLPEGTAISTPDSNGKSHIIKWAKVQADAGATATKYKVVKGHQFKVGDVVMLATSAAAYAITAIDTTNSAYDELTVGTTLTAASTGAYLYQASAAGASGSAYKYAAAAITGTGKQVIANQNFDVDAWVIAVTKGNDMPSAIASQLKGVINY